MNAYDSQITCLFWFETSHTLTDAEGPRLQLATSALAPEAQPTMGFRKWVTTILSMTQVSQNVILLALMFIYRLKKLNPSVKGKVGSEFRLLTVALMLGNKCTRIKIQLPCLRITANETKSWTTTPTPTRPGRKFPGYLSRRFMSWKLSS